MTATALLAMGIGLVVPLAVIIRVPRLRRGRSPAGDVLVVIPARNEAAVIGDLIDDLGRQSSLPGRVVIVDDQSDDDTALVASRHAACWPMLDVEVKRALPSPPSWNPKSWAIHQGVGGAEARLLFLDADVRLHPDALGALATLHRRDGGLLSVAPRHDVGGWSECLSFAFNVVALLGAVEPLSRRRGAAVAAFGPCLIVERASYAAVGGHRSVMSDLLDDVALGRRLRATGEPVSIVRGGALVRYRMYPGGMRALVEGWGKNIAQGATRTGPTSFVIVFAWVVAMLLPLVWFASARDGRDLVAAAVGWSVVTVHAALLAPRLGRFGAFTPLVAPFLVVFFTALTVMSAVRMVLRRPVTWKGRRLASSRQGHRG